MIDFSEYSAKQIVEFVDQNFNLFSAGTRDEEFPQNIISRLSDNLFCTVREKEGFALIARGMNELFGGDGKNAELMFLYVQPGFRKTGIGAAIVEKSKLCFSEGRIMEVKCEGIKRRSFFESMGFALVEYHEEYDQYNLKWRPSTQ
jgi:GNAT superfamily N-acetyltransferase